MAFFKIKLYNLKMNFSFDSLCMVRQNMIKMKFDNKSYITNETDILLFEKFTFY